MPDLTPPRPRGAAPSPRHVLAAATPHVATPAPSQFARLSSVLYFWGNDTYGDCVAAESMAAKAADGFLPSNAEGIRWASKHGWLNGASPTEVMDAAIAEGIPIGGKVLKDGPYNSVNWHDYPTLCSAIAHGQVKIGIAAGQVESACNESNGWVLLKARTDQNIDHCTGLAGYGTLAYCCQELGVPVPPNVDPALPSVIMFTWRTYGILSHAALTAICGEAWLRVPTTVSVSPTPPPPPTPTPTPTPNPSPWCHSHAAAAARHLVRAIAEFTKGFDQ